MIKVHVRHAVEQELLDFMRSQHRFTALDVATHCSAKDTVRDRFLQMMLDTGAAVPCGSDGRQHFLTTWGEAEAAKIKAATRSGSLTDETSHARLLDLIESARDSGFNVDIPAKTPRTAEEAKIWRYIAKRPHFTNADVESVFPQDPIMRTDFLRRLKAAKVIRFWGREDGKVYFTTQSAKEGRDTARDLRSTTEGAIWTAIRIKRRFRPSDVLNALRQSREDVTLGDVTRYCRTLAKAGFIKPPKPNARITADTPLLLIINAGPLPPQKRSVTVIVDPNEDKIVYSPVGQN
ncbi:hypothetical protein [Parasedimentitalea huanghaiensis]|uniref:Uncharacterized protein n=1 Tax=Parasedimentitalea huanghaiensis TaxID=2682100 RepID=A0A6L6WIP6_9RHOB|nr:hypothetical protein [Zongyanglinia huanghaiensis]MVO16829.1 hypothetical protein [Zongyanglinia huanghaiensis]